MARIQYKTEDFSTVGAINNKKLCAVVTDGYTNEFYNVNSSGVNNDDFKGTGFCKAVGNNYVITIGGVEYAFNSYGKPANGAAKGLEIKLCRVLQGGGATPVGEAAKSLSTSKVTKTKNAETGEITANVDTSYDDNEKDVPVDYLTIRDQFALQALHGIFRSIPNPCELSDNEVNYYCNAAYQWAANMMTVSANNRAQFIDNTGSVDPSSLETNTDKLLNKIGNVLTDIKTKLNEVNTSLEDIAQAIREGHQ